MQDYFSWRQSDATRNARIGYCYWQLRSEGETARKATSIMNGWNEAAQNEFLFSRNINFNDITTWHKRGIGFYYESYEKEGFNPLTQQKVIAVRRALVQNEELPMKSDYRKFVSDIYNE